jgi:hypothetical protein
MAQLESGGTPARAFAGQVEGLRRPRMRRSRDCRVVDCETVESDAQRSTRSGRPRLGGPSRTAADGRPPGTRATTPPYAPSHRTAACAARGATADRHPWRTGALHRATHSGRAAGPPGPTARVEPSVIPSGLRRRDHVLVARAGPGRSCLTTTGYETRPHQDGGSALAWSVQRPYSLSGRTYSYADAASATE